jgi:hypothetical protein
MGSGAKVGGLKRAARQLGVTSATLRGYGWRTASAGRIEAVKDNRAGWLAGARERRRHKRAGRCYLRGCKATVSGLGIGVRAVKERDITPSEAGGLLVSAPGLLAAGQERRQAQAGRGANERLRRDLTDALVTSVHDAWFQELKRAISDEEAGAIDARWAPGVDRARREAQQLAGELAPERVRARIGREQDATHDAGVYRASQLARRASGGQHG